MEQYATVAELRRLDGLGELDLFPDETLAEARAFAVEAVEDYTGGAWTTQAPPPVAIRWAVRTIARQWCVDLHSRIPDRATAVTTEFGQTTLAQAGGPWRPTSLPEVNAVLNRWRSRAPFG
ncbi:hypothetical protein JOD54_000835 [Actinokineospora baliensis]|uniref:hypothetical protein n=1 Tax=Actinokineospora baliensis TaxID=547056 RepID=UPI001957F442|nr:hypothetical protein [Actinokineospora baliensis]MBM7770631.1 hypothetical protein [Actinokineospora baliensis]